MKGRRMISLVVCAALTAGLLCAAQDSRPAEAAEASEALPASFVELMEEEGFAGVSPEHQDDLCNVIFEAGEGKRVLYIYDRPVKYVDETGAVRFKSEEMAQTDKASADGRTQYAYENPDNDIKAYLPRRAADGFLMEKDGYQVEFFPEDGKNSRARLAEGEERTAAVYANALEADADLSLSYTLDGIRLEIDIEEYTGQNEYTFTVDPHGLVPQALESHVLVFQDPETGEAVCTLQPMELSSAAYEQTGSYTDVSYNNSYRLQPAADGKYTLTVTLDQAFLSDPAAAYPLSAYTATSWRYDTGDTTVFAGDSGNYHTSIYDYVGYYPAGRSKLHAMKLAQMNTSVLKFINPVLITSAVYRTQVGGAADSWELIVGKPSFVWDPDTVAYSDVSDRWSTVYSCTLNNTVRQTLEVPITSLMKTWLRVELGESSALDSRQGIVLMPGDDCPQTSYRTFYSADHGTQAYRPAFVVEYMLDLTMLSGLYFIRNGGCERYLDVIDSAKTPGTNTCIYNFNGQNNQLWYLDVADMAHGYYTLRPYHASNMYLYAEDAYASPLILSSTPCYWHVIKNGDGTFRILVAGSERQAAESASGSTDNGTLVKTWGYGGAPNQKWVFEKASQIGGAGLYRQVNTETPNCLGYVLELSSNCRPLLDKDDTLQTFFDLRVKPEAESKGKKCRKLSSQTAYIRPNEYKVAMRIAPDAYVNDLGRRVNDYHFMVQLNTGEWAHKMGKQPSERLGNINPSTYSWDLALYNSDGSLSAYQEDFYHKPTFYFAVTR